MDAQSGGSRRCGDKIPPKHVHRHICLLLVTVWILLIDKAAFVRGESCGKRPIYKSATTRFELLTSPSYPQDYENNEHCQYILTTPSQSQIVQIESVTTDLVNWDGDKCEDYIAVYDGLDSKTKPLLRKWCGNEKVQVKSTGPAALVVFHTDQHLKGKGFALKYYAMDKYDSTCDPDRTVQLETSFNPLFLDLPSYTAPRTMRGAVVFCRYLLTTTQDDAGQVITLEDYTGIACNQGRFDIYDGPNDKSPLIVDWCHETNPFQVIATSGRQALITFTLQRPDSDWHVLRIRAVSRPKPVGCSDASVETIQVTSEAAYISYPYTTSVQGNRPCRLRLWAEGRTQTLRVEVVNGTKKGIECGDKGIFFHDENGSTLRLIGEACKDVVVHSSAHRLLVAPGKDYPMDKDIILKVVALDYPCNNDTEKREADNDAVQTLPSLRKNSTAYPNNARCLYLLSAKRSTDVVEVDVEGRMSPRAGTCGGDYVTFYDGENVYAPELGRWCGIPRHQKMTSTGPNLLAVVTSDDHDNLGDGFNIKYYSVPANGKCARRTNLAVTSTKQRLQSPNYPFYYPINAYCEYQLTAPEGHVVYVKVTNSEMEGDCSDMVRVYDGSESGKDNSLGRWCGTEKPSFKSTGRDMLLIFTADDRWNAGGFQLDYYVDTAESTLPAWAICLAVILPILLVVAVVVAVVFYLRHWRREQHKL